jgi:hypothetical protein
MSDPPHRSLVKLAFNNPAYGVNRDILTWRLRLQHRKAFLWLIVAVLIALIAIGIWLTSEWISYRNPPSIYGKIRLGDSREEVRYKLGDPPEVDDDVQSALGPNPQVHVNSINDLPANRIADQFNTWRYPGRGDDAHYDVYFDATTGRATTLACFDVIRPTTYYCPRLFEIAIDDSESEVIDVFGEATRKSINEGVKILEYDDKGIVVRLSKERVYSLQLSRPKKPASPSVRAFLYWLMRDG